MPAPAPGRQQTPQRPSVLSRAEPETPAQHCRPHSCPSRAEGPGSLFALHSARPGPPGRECARAPAQHRGVTCHSSSFLRSPFRELRALRGSRGQQAPCGGSTGRTLGQQSTPHTKSTSRQDATCAPGRGTLGPGQAGHAGVSHVPERSDTDRRRSSWGRDRSAVQRWTDGRQGLARQTGGRQAGRRSGRLPLGLREQQADMEPRAHQWLGRRPPVGPSEAAAAD